MKVSIAYVDQCLPDYFSGDARPWVCVPVRPQGYTSRELRSAILEEFAQGAIGGSDSISRDYIATEEECRRADRFFSKSLPACLNREIKYRGKKFKNDKKDDPDCEVYCYFVFTIEE